MEWHNMADHTTSLWLISSVQCTLLDRLTSQQRFTRTRTHCELENIRIVDSLSFIRHDYKCDWIIASTWLSLNRLAIGKGRFMIRYVWKMFLGLIQFEILGNVMLTGEKEQGITFSFYSHRYQPSILMVVRRIHRVRLLSWSEVGYRADGFEPSVSRRTVSSTSRLESQFEPIHAWADSCVKKIVFFLQQKLKEYTTKYSMFHCANRNKVIPYII